MNYRRFEWLIIGVTAALVVGAIAVSLPNGPINGIEIVAQLGIVVVVAAAAHWGRKVGTLVALAAAVVYLWIRLPLIASSLSGPAVMLVVSRIAGYLLLGIVGGEIFGRVKYVFARSHDSEAIDDFSHVFSQRFAAHAIRQALCRADRYAEPFSIVLVTLGPRFSHDVKPEHRRSLVRSVANVIRDDVRIVDDVAHLDDGRFAVILTHAGAGDARVVAARLAAAVVTAHGVDGSHVGTESLSAPEDRVAIEQLCSRIEPEGDEHH